MAAPHDTPPARKSMAGKSMARPLVVVGAVLVASAAAVGLYGMARPTGKNVAAHSGACARSLDVAEAIDPLIHGELAALQTATQPNDLGAIAFDDANGKKVTVASLKGKAILLNLWATWCVPCRTEMPSLDRLQASQGSHHFSVVPISVDTTRLERARAFFKDNGVKALPYYSDSTGDILHAFKQSKVVGLPTTILIGADGCEIATLAGPAQWDSPDAKALIERVKKSESGNARAA